MTREIAECNEVALEVRYSMRELLSVRLWQQGVISLVFSWGMKTGDGGSEIGTADPGLVAPASTIPDVLVPAALELVVVHSEQRYSNDMMQRKQALSGKRAGLRP